MLVPAKQDEAVDTETLPGGSTVASLEVEPKEVSLNGRFSYVQLLVTGKLSIGRDDRCDADG